jgi:hypothetical protein
MRLPVAPTGAPGRNNHGHIPNQHHGAMAKSTRSALVVSLDKALDEGCALPAREPLQFVCE